MQGLGCSKAVFKYLCIQNTRSREEINIFVESTRTVSIELDFPYTLAYHYELV